MSVMGTEQEEHDRYTKQELLGRCVLSSVVDLFPHVEVVVGAAVELERCAADPVEHEIRSKHVRDIGQSPRGLLRDAGDDIEEDLESEDEDKVNGPST